MTTSSHSTAIVQKLWNYCNILRDDGLSYGDYVEQLTYLLFLKMADERSQPFHDLLDLLQPRPMSRAEPVICIDEKSLQFIGHSREPLPMTEGHPAKHDYEYTRNGTTNLFVAVEPKAGQRIISVTERRGKIDFVAFVAELLTGAYAKARRVHLVVDNLNTHFRKCFDDVLGIPAATKLLRRVEFHYTPKHASWLNMAEIEIGMAQRQCLDRRMADQATAAWVLAHG